MSQLKNLFMKKILLLLGAGLFILSSCGESEEVTNCKIHYCNLKELTERSKNGEDVAEELKRTENFLVGSVDDAREAGHSDISEVLKNCDCKEVKH